MIYGTAPGYIRQLHHTPPSLMTGAELDRWAIQSKWGEARRGWLNRYLEPFGVFAIQPGAVHETGGGYSDCASEGYRIDCADAWVAATAALYDLPLVTHNRSDYRGVPGLTVVSHGA